MRKYADNEKEKMTVADHLKMLVKIMQELIEALSKL